MQPTGNYPIERRAGGIERLRMQAAAIEFALEMATFRTEDHKEAIRAFGEKRKPQFTGR